MGAWSYFFFPRFGNRGFGRKAMHQSGFVWAVTVFQREMSCFNPWNTTPAYNSFGPMPGKYNQMSEKGCTTQRKPQKESKLVANLTQIAPPFRQLVMVVGRTPHSLTNISSSRTFKNEDQKLIERMARSSVTNTHPSIHRLAQAHDVLL